MRMIVLSTESWDAKRQARKELLYKALLENNAIDSLLYIEPMLLWWRKRAASTRDQLFSDRVRVCRWHCLLPGERKSFIQSLNRNWQARRISACLSPGKKYKGVFYHPSNWLVARRLQEQVEWFYDWTEDWGVYEKSSHVAQLQEVAIRGAAGVITVCESLYKRACDLRGEDKDVLLLPNATSLSAQGICLDEPAVLSPVDKPRIGLMGHVGPWMDIELIIYLAKARPEWHWCILGEARGEDRERLGLLSNVHLLGIHPYEELPSFMAHMDVLVALYRGHAEVDSSKLYDYLTSGKPIISSDMDTAHRLSGGGINRKIPC